MKTTLEIADPLLEAARAAAAEAGLTLRAYVEAALREALERRPVRPRYVMPRVSKNLGGLRPEFANATFADLLDESYRGRGT